MITNSQFKNSNSHLLFHVKLSLMKKILMYCSLKLKKPQVFIVNISVLMNTLKDFRIQILNGKTLILNSILITYLIKFKIKNTKLGLQLHLFIY